MCGIKQFMRFLIEVQGQIMHLDVHILHMTRIDVVLGCECLHGLGPSLKHSFQHSTLTFNARGVHVLLMGE